MSSTDFHRLPDGSGEILANVAPGPSIVSGQAPRPLNRIREIRRNQCISLSYCARKLGVTTAEARLQEEPTADLTTSQLLAWQGLLDVPLYEMVVQNNVLEDPIRNRALLLKTMKTAKLINKTTRETRVKHMSESLIDQLIELMPELAEVSSWPDIGQSHENKDYGQAVYRRFDSDVASRFDTGY